MEFSLESIQSYIESATPMGVFEDLAVNPIPEAVLAFGGLVAVFMALLFATRGKGLKYRILTLFGVVIGVIMMVTVASLQLNATGEWLPFSMAILGLTGFALFFRPFRTLNLAVILGIVVGVAVFIVLGTIDIAGLEFLTDDLVRGGIAAVLAIMVFTAFRFVQEVALFFSKIINAWPILMALGLLALGESVAIYYDTSLLNYVLEYIDLTEAIVKL